MYLYEVRVRSECVFIRGTHSLHTTATTNTTVGDNEGPPVPLYVCDTFLCWLVFSVDDTPSFGIELGTADPTRTITNDCGEVWREGSLA